MGRALGGCLAVLALALPSLASPAGGPRSLAAKCGDTSGVKAQPFWLTAEDGIRLYAITVGPGPVTVILAHESPTDLCGWLPYIPTLTAAGIRVLAFDFRDMGDSDAANGVAAIAYDRDFHAALARARADGARNVFLMGASYGAGVTMAFAPRLHLDGVISLSGEAWFPRAAFNAKTELPHLRAPLLIVGSRHDRYLPVGYALMLLHRAGSKDKRTAFYPGRWHGWSIVEDAPYAPKARALILEWIRTRAG
jgi:pimeloyl-ACP methyl ester carboxylesterase